MRRFAISNIKFLISQFQYIGHLKFEIGNSHAKRDLGFTLIELLIVFAIIGIVSTFGIVVSIGYVRNQTLSTATQDLRSTLYSARSQAQSVVSSQCNGSTFTGVIVRFCNSQDKNSIACTTTQCQSNGNPDYEMDLICGGNYQAMLQKKTLPTGFTIQPDNCSVLFQPFTTSIIGNGAIKVSGFGSTQTMTVNANGVIQ